jgi:hypothetical protein
LTATSIAPLGVAKSSGARAGDTLSMASVNGASGAPPAVVGRLISWWG